MSFGSTLSHIIQLGFVNIFPFLGFVQFSFAQVRELFPINHLRGSSIDGRWLFIPFSFISMLFFFLHRFYYRSWFALDHFRDRSICQNPCHVHCLCIYRRMITWVVFHRFFLWFYHLTWLTFLLHCCPMHWYGVCNLLFWYVAYMFLCFIHLSLKMSL